MAGASALKFFMLREELKANHAERFLTYSERYHHEVLDDLKKRLADSWDKVIKHLPDPTEHAVKDAQLRNPDCTIAASVARQPEKIPFKGKTTEVSPSLKIPLVYSTEQRALILKKTLAAAEQAVTDVVHSWTEIFKHEKGGRMEPSFKITGDADEVRLQLIVKASTESIYKTLYSVRVEYGKASSKTRDFDRVYLFSFI